MAFFKTEGNGAYGGKQKTRYWDSYADFGGEVGRVYDKDVAAYTKKHLRFIDRFDIRKVVEASQYSFSILSKSVEEPKPKKKNWKYYRDV